MTPQEVCSQSSHCHHSICQDEVRIGMPLKLTLNDALRFKYEKHLFPSADGMTCLAHFISRIQAKRHEDGFDDKQLLPDEATASSLRRPGLKPGHDGNAVEPRGSFHRAKTGRPHLLPDGNLGCCGQLAHLPETRAGIWSLVGRLHRHGLLGKHHFLKSPYSQTEAARVGS